MKIVLILFAITLFISLSSLLFLKSPPVWPDEPIYASISLNILQSGIMRTELFSDTLPGSEDCACWYPPLFYIILSAWFTLWGFSIEAQRLLSVSLGAGFFYIWFRVVKIFIPEKNIISRSWIHAVMLLLIMTDINISVATRLSRPEIMVLVLTFISLYCYAFLCRQSPNKNLFGFFSGLAAGAAVLTHFISIYLFMSLSIHLLIIGGKKILKSWIPLILISGFLLPIGFYLFYYYPSLPITLEQIRLHGALKDTYSFGVPLNFTYILYGVLTITYLLYVTKQFFYLRKTNPLLILNGILLLISWTVAIWAKMHWYFVYPISFLYLGMSGLLHQFAQDKTITLSTLRLWHIIYAVLIFLVLFFNIQSHISLIQELGSSEKYSYTRLTQKLNRVPQGTSVFVFSIPDASYAFMEKNTVYKYIDVPIEPKKFFQLLDKSDYVITNQQFRTDTRGRMVTEYILLNTQDTYKIKEPNQYSMSVITLKPRGRRIHPQ